MYPPSSPSREGLSTGDSYGGAMDSAAQIQPRSTYDAQDWAPTDDNFKVVVRIRPPLLRELQGTSLRPYQCTTYVEPAGRIVTLSENLQAVLNGSHPMPSPDSMLSSTYRFTFDHVYDQNSSQERVYSNTAQHVVLSILQGYNAAIIAYGQTGTGKTFTMEGEMTGEMRGIIPRTVEDIFTYIVNDPEPSSKYLVRASYLQIYNEVISDMLKPERTNLIIREDRRRGVFVDGLSEWVVRSPGEVYQLMQRGQSMRAIGSTKLNEVSSRSHAVCIIIVEKCTSSGGMDDLSASTKEGGSYNVMVGKLNLVDLAGSERVHVTGAVGKRLEESKKINASLSALGNVIAALTARGERTHIPYRDSKLTRILEDSLGGNCRTTMICTVAPAMDAFQESLSTLKFANRAKNIKNEAHVNEDLDQRTLLRKYEKELRRLKAELQRRSRDLVDKRALLEVEEQKKRAEADKLAALTALEKRSREFLREKEEKRQLEAKIQSMQSQMLVGGAKLEDVPAFRAILAREHRRIRDEYESRLRDLESERQAVEEDRQQVDRYKQLLLKQRDIMIALTARLNERDDQISMLQEELEAYDKYQRQLEDALDGKTAELIALRRAALEHAGNSPAKIGVPLNNALGAWGGGGDDGIMECHGLARTCPVWSREPSGPFRRGRNEDTQRVADTSEPFEMLAEADQQIGGSDGGNGQHTLFGMTPHSAPSAGNAGVVGGSGANPAGGVGSLLGADSMVDREATLLQLRAENARLTGQLSAATAALQAAAENASWQQQQQQQRTGSSSVQQQQGSGVQDSVAALSEREEQQERDRERVEVLTAACVAAQKERSALHQILEAKVQRMMGDAIADAATLGGEASRQLTLRLKAMEQVLLKVGDAIRLAPPILPPEPEPEEVYSSDDTDGVDDE